MRVCSFMEQFEAMRDMRTRYNVSMYTICMIEKQLVLANGQLPELLGYIIWSVWTLGCFIMEATNNYYFGDKSRHIADYNDW